MSARHAAGHAVVVGAGLGGIAAALRLRALGLDVTLLDRLDRLGGRARTIAVGGILSDAGPTVITAPFLLEELFALFGERLADHVTLVPVTPFYRIRLPGGVLFDYSGDPDAMRAQIARLSPADVAGYDRLLAHAEALYETGYERHGATPFHRLAGMAAALPRLLRLGGHRSVAHLVARHIRDPDLRRVFSLQPLLVGGHPFETSGIYALILHLERRFGVWHACGGTAALVAALADLATRHGVVVRTGADVTAITVAGRRATGVVLRDGERPRADHVVSDIDPPTLYRELLPPALPRRRWTGRRLARLRYSMGLFVLYFTTTRRFPATAHHTIILGERWRALLDEIFGKTAHPPHDPSLYLHRPSATEPGIVPDGTDLFYVLAPVPNLRAPIDWARAARPLRDRIVAILDAGELPGLSGCLAAETALTPHDFETALRSTHGAGFSVAPRLLQSAWFRFHNRSEELDRLTLVGAGTHPGAGIPGVLTSARIAETLVRETLAQQGRKVSTEVDIDDRPEHASPSRERSCQCRPAETAHG